MSTVDSMQELHRYSRTLPIDHGAVIDLAKQLPSSFYLYDENGIRASAQSLTEAFSWVPEIDGVGFINHHAVKALSNPHIQEILRDEGMGADTSSGPELQISRAVGHKMPFICFTANHVDPREYREAYESEAIINLDDISQIDVLHQALDGAFPDIISFRYNPGSARTSGVNRIIGNPQEGKFGTNNEHLEAAYVRAKALGAKRFGLHTMVVSNQLGVEHHVATARMVFSKIHELSEKLGIRFEFANLGGGLGIPYEPHQEAIDYAALREGIEQAYKEIIVANNLDPLRVTTENGRHVTGPHGYFVATVQDVKESYYREVGLNAATIAAFPRPALYDAYHHIEVLGKAAATPLLQRIVGSLCEGNDYFTGADTKDRLLPEMEAGDVVVAFDAGAHCWEMGSSYNLKLRPAEYLLCLDGTIKQIRRAQNREDLFATLEYAGL